VINELNTNEQLG